MSLLNFPSFYLNYQKDNHVHNLSSETYIFNFGYKPFINYTCLMATHLRSMEAFNTSKIILIQISIKIYHYEYILIQKTILYLCSMILIMSLNRKIWNINIHHCWTKWIMTHLYLEYYIPINAVIFKKCSYYKAINMIQSWVKFWYLFNLILSKIRFTCNMTFIMKVHTCICMKRKTVERNTPKKLWVVMARGWDPGKLLCMYVFIHFFIFLILCCVPKQ